MQQIKNISIILILLLMASCIKLYDPVIDANVENKYVVSGRITDVEGWQEVGVSLSAPIDAPKYVPVSGCQVTIVDDKGNAFPLEEFSPGQYHVWMGRESLQAGTSYKVAVTAPDGEELASGFDKMPAGPKLDSVYYAIKEIPTSNPGINKTVMQFYVDLNAQGNYSQYYKWEVIETWEYQAARPVEYYYDGTFHQVYPPDYTNFVCWANGPVKNVFTLSTKSLTQNSYKQYPLHMIDGNTSRLGILYSMLVSQLALSEGAYNYWEQLRINSNEQGGLYEKQPLAIQGNLVNLSHPDRVVLGYFYTASLSSKRYFYKDVEGIYLDFFNFCTEDYLGKFKWKEFFTWQYPIYYYYRGETVKILNNECVDCRKMGGGTVKPDFWPK
ncbi:MAG: DUF4249 domain-containing protein [Bacteroidota bacterium]